MWQGRLSSDREQVDYTARLLVFYRRRRTDVGLLQGQDR